MLKEELVFEFYEFFSGGGMARAGLGEAWACKFANDINEMKCSVYAENWGDDHLKIGDVNDVTTDDLQGQVDLSWASFPCQDLSLAGSYAGIGHRSKKEQSRSGTFWPFWSLMRQLQEEKRAPKIIALENVFGILRSNGGKDFQAVASAFSGAGYRFGTVVVDAKQFVPQSRPRVFIIGIRRDLELPASSVSDKPNAHWHPTALVEAHTSLSSEAKRRWVWWNMPVPAVRNKSFSDIIRDEPIGVSWNPDSETKRLLGMMTERNLQKVEKAKRSGSRKVGGLYKRTRKENGTTVQRAEVRFDDVAGCLRTPTGGSSRQTILLVHGESVKSRLLAPVEAIELMGMTQEYKLPKKYNDAYYVAGDGVVVPVVRHLAEHVFEPVLRQNEASVIAAE